MLRNVRDLLGYAIHATDGAIGTVDDVYLDDEDWTVRYMVVSTGGWLSGRRVLISPIALGRPDWLDRTMPVSLNKRQVERSPIVDTEHPVSREIEASYLGYFGYPCYWDGEGLWGVGAYPGGLAPVPPVEPGTRTRRRSDTAPVESHLRSYRAVKGYHLHASDLDIGHVHDMLLDEQTWAVRYLVVNTSNWWGGHLVLIAASWIDSVSWVESTISIDLTRDAVKDAPPYEESMQLNRQQEQAIHDHYRRQAYWYGDDVPVTGRK